MNGGPREPLMSIHETPKGLNVDDVMRNVRVISEVIGGNWVMKKIKEEKKVIERFSIASKNRKHAYLYKPEPHPLIAWALEFEKWQAACLESKRFELNEAVLRLAVLGQNLDKSRYQSGFEKLVGRLKQRDSFFSAAFEVEVAASYSSKGYSVRFIEEGNERTPDLRVARSDGSHFWVECKCRDNLTERDKTIEAIWKELEASLVREIGPRKQNVAVIVKSLHDPKRCEIADLRTFLLESIAAGGLERIDPNTAELHSVLDPTGRYQVSIRTLSAADEEIEGEGFEFRSSEKPDRFLMQTEMRVDEDKRRFFSNPFTLGFKNNLPSDKVTGIIHGFNSAVGQLPKEGPGVVWIRIPDNSWNDDFDASVEKAEILLKSELSGDMNRRVNAVILMTRLLHPIQDGVQNGLAYHPVILTVEHPNPRHAIKE